jgi:UDP-GlcNAc:undecaprenyl-phosphate GlcNAc-1-phosphate transferase
MARQVFGVHKSSMGGIVLPLIAFVSTVILILTLRPIAVLMGLMDVPNARKLHTDATPLLGGIAIYIAILISVVAGAFFYGIDWWMHRYYIAFFIGGAIMVMVGALDDRRGLSTTVRFVYQTISILIMALGADVVLRDVGALRPGGYVVQLGMLSIPFTVLACVGVINAINMSDGLDGLSGNLILVTLLGFGIANSLWGDIGRLQLLNIVSAAVAGFLIFNQRIFWRTKAWVFMGDAGSMMLGFFLAWYAVEVSQEPNRVISPAATLWLLMVPLYDTVTVMLRRLMAGKSPMQPDSKHLHHLFIRLGYSVGETITIICLLAGVGLSIGLVGTALGVSEFLLGLTFLIGGIVYLLGIERAWKRRALFGRSFVADALADEMRAPPRHQSS